MQTQRPDYGLNRFRCSIVSPITDAAAAHLLCPDVSLFWLHSIA